MDIAIKELAKTIKEVEGFNGKICFDLSKPDEIPRKFLDFKLVNSFGFKPKTKLKEGLYEAYKDYIKLYYIFFIKQIFLCQKLLKKL